MLSADPSQLAPQVRVMQIIVGALTSGCIAVMVTMFLLRGDKAPQPAMPTLTYLGLAFSGAAVLARIFLPRLIANQARSGITARDEASVVAALLPVFQTRLIIGAAILEGAVFFLAIAYMLEGQSLALGVGAALTLGIATQFPTTGSVSNWLTEQHDLLRQTV